MHGCIMNFLSLSLAETLVKVKLKTLSQVIFTLCMPSVNVGPSLFFLEVTLELGVAPLNSMVTSAHCGRLLQGKKNTKS